MASVEEYAEEVGKARTSPDSEDPGPLRRSLEKFDFAHASEAGEAVRFVTEGLWTQQVHTPHPRYFGLFNPAPTTMGIVADTLVAAFNPQMAAWSHNPFSAEVERHLIRAFGRVFGFPEDEVDGTFATGGAEANLSALLCALVQAFPQFSTEGLCALEGQPVLYVSEQAHHSFLKAARCCGLGSSAVRQVPVEAALTMNVSALRRMIERDRAKGYIPFLVVATAGTTGAGVIDPIAEIVTVAREEGLWSHVDAAWGGAAAMIPELKHVLAGIEDCNSITFDAHKFLSAPMGAGLFLTRDKTVLARAFRITTDYMPPAVMEFDVVDPYRTSIQWSRRFIGLKVFLSLAVAGWDGYARVLRHQVAMGDELRKRLSADGWRIVNQTPLPVVCFTDDRFWDTTLVERIAEKVVRSGKAWISTAKVPALALRACITNYRTDVADLAALVEIVGAARKEALKEV
jgi:glutamate/tyrosine decarboxylase-like PLP-dependent enzyme